MYEKKNGRRAEKIGANAIGKFVRKIFLESVHRGGSVMTLEFHFRF